MKLQRWRRKVHIKYHLFRFIRVGFVLVFAIIAYETYQFKSRHSWEGIEWMTVFAQQPVATPTVDRLAIPVMPENPTLVDIGRNLYYYHCMPCHGDIGQGLTDEWREVWVDDHQNCWASGCHGGRAMDEGFPIPTSVPAVIGDSAKMYHFPTQQDLFNFLSQSHPPQRPGVLDAEESQALAVFLLSENKLFDAEQGFEAVDPTPVITPALDRLAKPTLPASPSQADEGAVDYWFSCMVCHGDRGQGLTEEWRAAAGQEDMNCWQSRCHASNHPPEGFVLPRYAPRIIGEGSLARFDTAVDLYAYISEEMPWQMPGLLDEDIYWRMTAFLLRENGIVLGDEPLGPRNAAQVHLRDELGVEPLNVGSEIAGLREDSAPENITTSQEESASGQLPVWVVAILAGALLAGLAGWSFYRSRNLEG